MNMRFLIGIMVLVVPSFALFDEGTSSMDPIFQNSLHYPGGVRKALGFSSYFDRNQGYWGNPTSNLGGSLSSNSDGLGLAVSVSFNASRILVGRVPTSGNYSSGDAVLYEAGLGDSYTEVHVFGMSSVVQDWSYAASSVALSPGGDMVIVSAPGDNVVTNLLPQQNWVNTIEDRAGSIHMWIDQCSTAFSGGCDGGWQFAGVIYPPLPRFPYITQFGKSVQFSERSSFIVSANINPAPSDAGVYGGRVFLYQYRNLDSLADLISSNNSPGGASLLGYDVEGDESQDPSDSLLWPIEMNPYPDEFNTGAGNWQSDDLLQLQAAPNAVISASGNAILAGFPIFHDPNMVSGTLNGPIRKEGRAYVIKLTQSDSEFGYLVPETKLISGHAPPVALRPDTWSCQTWSPSFVRPDHVEYWQTGAGCDMAYNPSNPDFVDNLHGLTFGAGGLWLSSDGEVALVGTPNDKSLSWAYNGTNQTGSHGSAWACSLSGVTYSCSRLTPSLTFGGGYAGTTVALSRDGAHAIVGGNVWYDSFNTNPLSTREGRVIRQAPLGFWHEQQRADFWHEQQRADFWHEQQRADLLLDQARPNFLALSGDDRRLIDVGQINGTIDWRGAKPCPGAGIPKLGADGVIRCSCYSGYAGGLCQDFVDDLAAKTCSAPVWKNLTALETEIVPDFPAFIFDNNRLRLEVLNDLTNNRLWTEVRITNLDNYNVLDDPVCGYPGPSWWKYTGDLEGIPGYDPSQPCKERWSGLMPWEKAVNCFKEDLAAPVGYKIYEGYATIHHHDLVDNFRGIDIFRDTEHVIPLKIRFQTQITLSTDVTIYAPINLLAAIVEQTYDPGTNTAILRVAVQLQHPFVWDDGVVSADPAGLPSVVIPDGPDADTIPDGIDTSACPDQAGAPCTVYYTIRVAPDPTEPAAVLDSSGRICTLNGVYEVSGTARCHTSVETAGNCPITSATDDAVSVQLNVVSSSFCPGVEIDVGANGELVSFEDDAFLFERDDFFIETNTYFQAIVALDEPVNIIGLTFEEIFISYIDPEAVPAVPENHFLYQSGSPTTLGSAMDFAVIPYPQNPAQSYEARFRFRFRSRYDLSASPTSPAYSGIPNGLPIRDDANLVVTTSARIKIDIEGMMQSRRTTMTFLNPQEGVVPIAREDRQATGSQIVSSTSLTPATQVAVVYNRRNNDNLGVNPPVVGEVGGDGAALAPFWL